MKFQAWMKRQNSASHFTTDLLQMHRESHSWVHRTQQKFEEDQSFTCMMFREGLGTHSHCRGKEPCGTPSRESPRGWTGLGPSHHPGKGAGSQSTPQPHCQTSLWWHTGSGAQLESLQVRVWVNRVHNQAGMRQGWGQGHLQLGWGQTEGPWLSWNGVHFNAFHSAKSSSQN